MTGKLKTAFDSIQAEDTLKTSTMDYLQNLQNPKKVSLQRNTEQRRIPPRYLSCAFASIAILLFSGLFAYRLYCTPSAYIAIEVNPSIEIILNRFDRVIDTCAYNMDGETILREIDIRNKKYEEAIAILMGQIIQDGYAKDDSLISVTLQSDSPKSDETMLSNIESAVQLHHTGAQVECFAIDPLTRDTAHHLNLSPAKYLAIQALMEVEPDATISGCMHHSIQEIRELTRQHSGHHSHTVDSPAGTVSPDNSQNGHHCHDAEHDF